MDLSVLKIFYLKRKLRENKTMNMNTILDPQVNEHIDTNSVVESKEQYKPLHDSVKHALENLLSQLDGQPISELYDLVLAEVERPLFEFIMTYTKGNQSKAARILGISRGTLRKKLKVYDIN